MCMLEVRQNMSKLYMTATSDKAKSGKTMGGHRWIDLELGYDPSDFKKTVSVRMNVPDDTKKATLWVNGQKIWEEGQ